MLAVVTIYARREWFVEGPQEGTAPILHAFAKANQQIKPLMFVAAAIRVVQGLCDKTPPLHNVIPSHP